jgi:hypothetical protein
VIEFWYELCASVEKQTFLIIIFNINLKVMNCGRIVDDNIPYLLLKQENSYFSKLVQQTGHIMSNRLRESALQNFNNRRNSKDFNESKDETILRHRNAF